MLSKDAIRAARDVRLHLLSDPYRPAFHFVVPEDWAHPADPNGAVWWGGRYHLGYIYQDSGVHHWGHVSSLDLVHWRHHKPWIVPTADSPETGIYSGNCFIAKDGSAVMLYHGVGSGNCIATSRDPLLDEWSKLPSNPIVPIEGPGIWRKPVHLPYASWDPHGWRDGDTYYAIFGGSRPAIFKARELGDWHYVGDLFAHGLDGISLSEDVSCPDFFRLGDKWVLICISHELGCRYYVGDWRDEKFHPLLHEQMSWADNTLFAPESLEDGSGRRIMWCWIRDHWDDATRAASGWAGTFSLPRELWLRPDLKLGMRPVEELKQLRYNPHILAAASLASDTLVGLGDVGGACLDIEITIEPGDAALCGIMVCRSPDGTEETMVGYDRLRGELFIDTSKSSVRLKTDNSRESGPLTLATGEALRLRVLVDKSVVEVFANDRQAVLRRIYPSRADSIGVALFSSGGASRIAAGTVWEMMPSNAH